MDPSQEVRSSPDDDITEQNQSSVSLKKSSTSKAGNWWELAQPKRFGWLKTAVDVTACKASFAHVRISQSYRAH